MTEEQWLTEQNRSQWMILDLLEPGKVQRTNAGKRKLRLFACGCCRIMWHLLDEVILRPAVETAETFADGETSKDELHRYDEAIGAMTVGGYSAGEPGVERRTAAAMVGASCLQAAGSAAFMQTAYAPELVGALEGGAVLCHLLRDIFGNPFRPSVAKREWVAANDRSVEGVARSVYQDRAFDRMPILADALEDAGCDDEEILAHCRGAGPHVRGCWVVDLILGKG